MGQNGGSMKFSFAVVMTLLLGTSLSACGSSHDDAAAKAEAAKVTAYCAALKKAAPEIKAYDKEELNFRKLQSYFDVMQSLAKKSPAAVSRDWNVINFDITEIERSSKAANLNFVDIPKLAKGKIPKGAKPAKFDAVTFAFNYLKSVNLATATTNIADNAAKVCKVDLTPNSA